MPSPAGRGGATLHWQAATGWRQLGHMRPVSVLYTRPLLSSFDFMILWLDYYFIDSYSRLIFKGNVPK